MRNGLRHFDRDFNRVQRIAIAFHDQCPGLNCRKVRRSEVHIVIAVGESSGAREKGIDLGVPAGMTSAKNLPLPFGQPIGILAHDGTCLRGKVRRGANQHHRLYALRLPGRHMQQDVAAPTGPQSLASADFQMIEQREYIRGGILMPEGFRKNARPGVTAQVRHDQLEVLTPLRGKIINGPSSGQSFSGIVRRVQIPVGDFEGIALALVFGC